MFKTISTMTGALAVLFTASAAFPQSNPPQVYSTAIYLKVAPEKETAFVEFYKTGAGAKVVRARMKADPDAIGWSLRRAVFAGDPAPSANFVIIAAGNGASLLRTQLSFHETCADTGKPPDGGKVNRQ